MTDGKDVSREDDFRDYEQRDIRDGWPYSDKDGAATGRNNAPYGVSGNPDRADATAVEVAADPVERAVDGAPLPFSDDTDDVISDDDLEERITQFLEDEKDIDLVSVEISVKQGVAHLDGSVDSEEDRQRLVAVIGRVKGVRAVRASGRASGLLTRGVDSHLPKDAAD